MKTHKLTLMTLIPGTASALVYGTSGNVDAFKLQSEMKPGEYHDIKVAFGHRAMEDLQETAMRMAQSHDFEGITCIVGRASVGEDGKMQIIHDRIERRDQPELSWMPA